ncbi:glutathione S-transferase N-terminal domain-containing protein [Paraburkholderia sp. BL25I1N1]|uniref:glutathione S-transferase N-terminal domain-containing protein n=1 Tax=Paraburkholderia sp. BL25I1N1 TaxID=1938804 RepID=UPI000D43DEED|nr:glutathione S-transferase N-terminal domain-containing protein [Paraburkholderia sp. BL25I1N1]PRY07767.1 glutathione S-transferase-like protein [Paraburkholderia sp. BL25I1N1]
MIDFYLPPTPNPAKVDPMLEETGLEYELRLIDTKKGERHFDSFLKVKTNGKVPAIGERAGPAGREASAFDSSAILFCLAENPGKDLSAATDRPERLLWLLFVSSGVGPFSGQSVQLQHGHRSSCRIADMSA